MSDDFQREWHFYLNDMIEFAEKVLTYTKGLDQAGFLENELTYDDTLWSIIQDDVPELLPVLEALRTEAGKTGA